MATPAFGFDDPFDEEEDYEDVPIVLGRRCNICGCTTEDACLGHDGEPCHWVTPTLCSACMEP
jgi:hypothetical protein